MALFSRSKTPAGSIATGYAAPKAGAKLEPVTVERRPLSGRAVRVEVHYCGVCHSDLHQVNNDWLNSLYPCMPGHEIVGRVAEVADGVTQFTPGDLVAVGCMVDSCRTCSSCREGNEQYCEGQKGFTGTYNGPLQPDGTNTYGGYSDHLVVDEHFVLALPKGLDPKTAAPILCAGVTTYSPMKHWGVGAGTKVGVAGLGGLGHMAVQLAKAMGAHVTVVTTSKDKREDAEALGADAVLLVSDKKALKAAEASLDFVLDTIPYDHDFTPYLTLVRRDGAMTVVGQLMPSLKPLQTMELISKRRTLAGSLIGGIEETKEVLAFCAEHGIAPRTETIAIQDVNKAFKALKKGDVRFRYVIDMASIRKDVKATKTADVKDDAKP